MKYFGVSVMSLALSMALAGCADTPLPEDAFMKQVSTLCGQTYTGAVISEQAVDADWRKAVLTLGPVVCDDAGVHMPLAVGEDRSRTWHLSRDGARIEFRHEHILKDGSPDPVSFYGGYSRADGTATRMDFPADEKSKTMFIENGLDVSVSNVWTLTLEPGERLSYALARPERDFRAEFDLGE